MNTEQACRTRSDLTPKRRGILAFVAGYWAQHGRAPVIREVGDWCGISSTSVTKYHLDELERLGLIDRPRFIARAMTITAAGREALGTEEAA